MEGIERQKQGGTTTLEKWIISGKDAFPQGRAGVSKQVSSPVRVGTLQTDGFKIPLLGETRTATGLFSLVW